MVLLRLFKDSRTAGTAGILLLGLALFLPPMIAGTPLREFSGMPFYSLIFGSIHEFPILNRLLALTFYLLGAYMLIRISARNVLLSFRSFMPAYFFLLFAAALPATRQMSPDLLASMFYLFAFAILFESGDKKQDTYTIFNAGLVLAMGSMFCARLVWFLPLVWISLGTLRNISWRELFYPVTAFLLVLLLLFTWYWGILDNGQALRDLLKENLFFGKSWGTYPRLSWLYYGWFLLLIILASIFMIASFQSRKTVVQDIFQVLFFMFIGGVLYFSLIRRTEPVSLVYIGFPVAFIMSNYFHRKRNHWSHELMLWILVGLLIFIQFRA